MMQCIEVHGGAKVDFDLEIYPLEEAERILLQDKKQLYWYAARREEQGVLCRPFFQCPHCGTKVPAYPLHMLYEEEPVPVVDAEQIEAWADRQISLFETEDMLHMRSPLIEGEYSQCSYCDEVVVLTEREETVNVESSDGVVRVGRTHDNLQEVMKIPWVPDELELQRFPVTETLEFDLRHQKVRLKLSGMKESGSDTDVLTVDVSMQFHLMRLGELGDYTEYEKVRRAIHQGFAEEMGKEPPIPSSVVRLRDFVMMTKFYGFSRAFYDAVPYKDPDRPDTSFLPWAEKLQNVENVPKLLAASALPDVKSVKRAIYEKQGLLFYLPECEELYGLLQDVNLFCNFLKEPMIFEVLLSLHMYPGTKEFYRDFAKTCGTHALVSRLKKQEEPFFKMALSYCAMHEDLRKEKLRCFEQDHRYLRHRKMLFREMDPIPVSRPMMEIPQYLEETEVDGFLFSPLRTTIDFERAGRVMDNCLGEWKCTRNPVVVMYKGDRMVAAIEVDKDKKTVQAYLRENEEMHTDPEANEAYWKWSRALREPREEEPTAEVLTAAREWIRRPPRVDLETGLRNLYLDMQSREEGNCCHLTEVVHEIVDRHRKEYAHLLEAEE